jgi:hypothetical protein
LRWFFIVEENGINPWEHEYKYSALPVTFSLADFPGTTATNFGPSLGHAAAIIYEAHGVYWHYQFQLLKSSVIVPD